MATFSIPGQNLNMTIPDDGEIFRYSGNIDPTQGSIFKRVGNQVVSLGIENLGQQYLQQQGGVPMTRTQAGLSGGGPTNVFKMPNGEIVQLDKGVLQSYGIKALGAQGVDFNSIPQKNYIDLTAVFGRMPGYTFGNTTDVNTFKPTEIKTGEVITQQANPNNPNAMGNIVSSTQGVVTPGATNVGDTNALIPHITATGVTTTQPGAVSGGTGGSASSLPTINQNLMPGSQGDDVTALQTWLKSQGFFPKEQEATGYYGDITKKAVADWQKSVGIQTTSTDAGYFGPQSRTALANLSTGTGGGTPTYSNVPAGSNSYMNPGGTGAPVIGGDTSSTGGTPGAGGTGESVTGDTTMDSFLKVMKDYLGQNTVDPTINVSDPAVVANFLEMATKELHPYYAQKIGEIMPDLNRSLGLLKTQFDTNLANQEQTFQQNLASQRESAAGAGTVFSGARGLGEQNTISAQQRSLDLSRQTAENTAGNALRSAESQLGSSGMDGFNLPNFGSAQVSGAGARGGFNLGTSGQYYNPGQYKYGTLPLEEKTAIENLVNTRIKAQQTKNISDRTFSGLSNL